jgi:glycosyltransferase involved in cell wall biosynthesis
LNGSPPRLALIIGSLRGGGAERQLSAMANYWARQGAQVTLATWSGPEVEDFYPLLPAVTRCWLDVRAARPRTVSRFVASVHRLLRLRRLLRDVRPHALISFMDISNVYSILAARSAGVRVVVAERTHPALNRGLAAPWRVLRRICYRWADRVVVQTRDAGGWVEHHCHARVSVIPNLLRELPQPGCEREPLILGVGRLSREKGFDVLLEAFASLAARFPQWRVCLIGEGSERAALASQRDELGLGGRVEFLGELRGVESWMGRAALLVHPSRREGFPNSVLEAMGMGMAVICADCRAGPSELIRDGSNGRLVPVDDVEALTRVMAELMAQPQLRERLGREARQVRETFGEQNIMQQWQVCVLPAAAT